VLQWDSAKCVPLKFEHPDFVADVSVPRDTGSIEFKFLVKDKGAPDEFSIAAILFFLTSIASRRRQDYSLGEWQQPPHQRQQVQSCH